ncbi:BLUF domain-containing protein [Stenotrophomonas sp. 364]|uniref:BLUF domain-containing protein n=1 Tax=Stenotrophomonas sp. 364 TaxID=2691571 RepID=UPI00131859C1|nr:BLUF domain-containing protein [Stenotrophomonas sp. 364]QHB71791.1 F420H(2):quinone oxidoreductase [Stenotrophomonas sp. 364]
MIETSNIYALAYSSRCSADVLNSDLDEILVDASAHNRMADVTGVLLFDGVNFLQYLEGPEEAVASVFDRIKSSKRHKDIRVLTSGEVPERYFWNWSMACAHADASMIQRIEAARWGERTHPHLEVDGEQNPGLRLLADFWSSVVQHQEQQQARNDKRDSANRADLTDEGE